MLLFFHSLFWFFYRNSFWGQQNLSAFNDIAVLYRYYGSWVKTVSLQEKKMRNNIYHNAYIKNKIRIKEHTDKINRSNLPYYLLCIWRKSTEETTIYWKTMLIFCVFTTLIIHLYNNFIKHIICVIPFEICLITVNNRNTVVHSVQKQHGRYHNTSFDCCIMSSCKWGHCGVRIVTFDQISHPFNSDRNFSNILYKCNILSTYM